MATTVAERKAKKRATLNKWRAEHREQYNKYIREWRAKKLANPRVQVQVRMPMSLQLRLKGAWLGRKRELGPSVEWSVNDEIVRRLEDALGLGGGELR